MIEVTMKDVFIRISNEAGSRPPHQDTPSDPGNFMLGDISGLVKIYIVYGYTDMRKYIDGLCAIIEDQLQMEASSSALFLFCGRRRDRIKALFHEPDGFVRKILHRTMASSAKDIQLRELKDTISQLKTTVSEQTELIKSLRLIIDEKSSHEKALQEQFYSYNAFSFLISES